VEDNGARSFEGEVEPCVNGITLAVDALLGEAVGGRRLTSGDGVDLHRE
jgi:hypothetical protein